MRRSRTIALGSTVLEPIGSLKATGVLAKMELLSAVASYPSSTVQVLLDPQMCLVLVFNAAH